MGPAGPDSDMMGHLLTRTKSVMKLLPNLPLPMRSAVCRLPEQRRMFNSI
jgi:hypothetical protein